MSLYSRSINSIVSFYVVCWCQGVLMSVLANDNYGHNDNTTAHNSNITSYRTRPMDNIIMESEGQTATLTRKNKEWDTFNSSVIQSGQFDYKSNLTDNKHNKDNNSARTETPLSNSHDNFTDHQFLQLNHNTSPPELNVNKSVLGNVHETIASRRTAIHQTTTQIIDVTINMNNKSGEAFNQTHGPLNDTGASDVTTHLSNIRTDGKDNITKNGDVLYVDRASHNDVHGHQRTGETSFKQTPLRRHHLQIVPMEDEPFGAFLWKDERYMVSIIIPIGVGITGAAVIMVTLYTLRYIARKNARGFHFPDLEHATQTTSCISSISSERTDRVVLLGGDEDDEF